jgi:transposase/copper chaperone CopZ
MRSARTVARVGGVHTVETAVHIFRIRNMHCDDCAALIDDTLRAIPGVRTAHATYRTREIQVELDRLRTSPETVTAAITELGFQVRPPTIVPTQPVEPVEQQVSDSAWRVLEPLLVSTNLHQTKRARAARQVFEGIAYKHREKVPWRDVPAKFGPWQTLYARLARWRSDGTWSTLTAAARHSAFADELAWLDSAAD